MKYLKFKRSLIFTLILALVFSCTPFALANTVDQWVLKAPMSTPRAYFQSEVVNGKIYVIGGAINNKATSSLALYDPISDTWTEKASMHTPRNAFQSEILDGKIYAIGGEDSIQLSSMEAYDPSTNTWTIKASMPAAKEQFCTEVVNGKIYAIGGAFTTSVYEYDPITNKWTTKASMSTPRREFQTEVIDGKIYAIGGQSVGAVSGTVNSVEEYDPELNTWTKKASMLVSRVELQTVVVDGKIIAIGGEDNKGSLLNSVEEYNPKTNTWSTKASMTSNRYFFQTESLNGMIYAIGGAGGHSPNCEAYNPATDTWTPKESMHDSRSCFRTEIINGNIYAIGGPYVSSVEVYTSTTIDPTLTVTASSNNVKVGSKFTTTVAIHHVSNIFAEDISIHYDSSLFDYVGADALPGLTIYEEDKSTPGTVRFIVAHLGTENAANGDKDLINLTFKAKAPGTGKVDITKGRIADNSTLEMDIAEKNCGEDTITVEPVKDVNRSGEFTLLDLGIDAGYYGIDASQTDSTRFDTDVVADGVIDDNDLTSITASILENSNYQPNN